MGEAHTDSRCAASSTATASRTMTSATVTSLTTLRIVALLGALASAAFTIMDTGAGGITAITTAATPTAGNSTVSALRRAPDAVQRSDRYVSSRQGDRREL